MDKKIKDLFLSKHVDFISNYGKTHDVYVKNCSFIFIFRCMDLLEFLSKRNMKYQIT
jgi:hypothetical protein